MRPGARWAAEWTVAFLFFLVTGPLTFYLGATASHGQNLTFDLTPTTAALTAMAVAPYILWCLYFAVRPWRRPAGLPEHFLIVIVATPILAFLSSMAAYVFVGNATNTLEEPFFVLVLPVIYAWQFVQYIVVQLLDQRWRKRAANA